jgi:hypothetical protein
MLKRTLKVLGIVFFLSVALYIANFLFSWPNNPGGYWLIGILIGYLYSQGKSLQDRLLIMVGFLTANIFWGMVILSQNM